MAFRKSSLFLVLLSFLVGVQISSTFSKITFAVVVGSGLFFLFCVWIGKELAWIFVFLFLGLLHHQCFTQATQRSEKKISKVFFYNTFFYQGKVMQLLFFEKERTKVLFYIQKYRKNRLEKWSPLSLRVLLSIQHPQEPYLQGDSLLLYTKLHLHRFFGNPSNTPFQQIQVQRGIPFRMSVQARKVLLLRKGNDWKRKIEEFRLLFSSFLSKNVSNAEALSFVQAILLGFKQGLSSSLRDTFSHTGTSHLLAISGLHMSLVGSMSFVLFQFVFSWCVGFLSFRSILRLSCFFSFSLSWFYLLVSGQSISALRAFVMLCFVLLGKAFFRTTTPLDALVCAAFVIVVLEPNAMKELSFHLSFLAVFVLMTLIEKSQNNTADSRWQAFWEFLQSSLSSSWLLLLVTFPLTMAFSQKFPVLSPFANLLAIPFSGILLSFSFLTFFFYWIPFLTFFPLFLVLELSTSCLLLFLQALANAPFATITLYPFVFIESTIYWFHVVVAFLLKGKFRIVLSLLFLLLLGFQSKNPLWNQKEAKKIEVTFIDIGQGDAIFIRFPNQKTMLVDGGGEAFLPIDLGKQVLLPFLHWKRCARIDYLVLSHPHPDHFGGLTSVIREIPIGEFWWNGETSKSRLFQDFIHQIHQKKVKQRVFLRPTVVPIGEVSVRILHPFPKRGEGKSHYWALGANDNSLAFQMRWKSFSFLFLGDLEDHGETLLLQKNRGLKSYFLKVPHHGSRTSSTEKLLQRVQPKHAFVSLGRNNMFRFPHPQVLSRYKKHKIPLWRTDQKGMIEITSDGKRFQIQNKWGIKSSVSSLLAR